MSDDHDRWSSYATPSFALLNTSIACLGAGEQSGTMEPFRNRLLPSHGLVAVTSGHGQYTWADGRRENVTSPALIWLYPGVKHGYGPGPAGWAEHWILYTGAASRTYEDLGLVDPTRPVVALERAPLQLDYLFSSLRSELDMPGIGAQLRASILVQRMLEACVFGSTSGASREGRAIVEALVSSAFETVSIHQRALRFGITEAELADVVRTVTGLTPHAFILEVRLARARALLAETNLDIQLIAAEIGYADPAYFSRFFTNRVGVSPSAFRRQQYRGSANGL